MRELTTKLAGAKVHTAPIIDITLSWLEQLSSTEAQLTKKLEEISAAKSVQVRVESLVRYALGQLVNVLDLLVTEIGTQLVDRSRMVLQTAYSGSYYFVCIN